jgi:hypothetical protein
VLNHRESDEFGGRFSPTLTHDAINIDAKREMLKKINAAVADAYGLPVTFLRIAVAAFGLGLVSLLLKGVDPDLPEVAQEAASEV